MKLVVLGATGGTGLEIVRQAVEHHHGVTALVRSPDALKGFAGRIAVVRGDLLSRAEVQSAVEGHDAVPSSFGPRVPIAKADSTLLRRFALAVTEAMLRTRVRRVVVLSTAFLFRDSILPPTHLVGRLFFPGMVVDATEMEGIVSRSGLDWTIVRPPRLTDQPLTAKYRVRESHLPGFGFTISRADVADFMIRTLENRSSVGKVEGISN
jgi:putative NADH-flavin reductase